MKVQVVGIPWYEEQHYARLRQLFKDGANLPETFAGWLKSAEKAVDEIKRKGGITVLKVNIDPDEFPAWCGAHGHDVDARARLAFANRKAYEFASTRQDESDSVH